jgi:penicillin-binding protein 4
MKDYYQKETKKVRAERKRGLKKKQKKIFFKRCLKIVLWSVLFLFLLCITVGMGVLAAYKDDITSILEDANKKISSINEGTFKSRTETVVYDAKDRVIARLAINDYYYVESKDIQPMIPKAFIAIEDNRFFEHKGVDVKATMRAAYHLLKNKGEITQGGSTITQQLVKNVFLSHERTYKRKFEEIIIAKKLEEKYSKELIMEFYLNNIYFGNGAYGIETASRTYFNKPSQKLTLSEIAFLAGLPNNPSLYNPLKHMDNAIARRNLILSKMKELHFITEEQYIQAKKQKIVLNMPKRETKPESYAVSFALSSATKLLMEREGFEFKYWFDTEEERKAYWNEFNEKFAEINKKIRNGGYAIYTTINTEKQQALQKSIDRGLSGFTRKNPKTGLYKTQGAAVTIDNKTGDVVAIVGGRTQEGVDNSFNRAFLSYRQPGSIIKPLVAYTPAFEKGMLASTIVVDRPLKNGPKNAGNTYRGPITIREAVERSINTVAFQLVVKNKPEIALSYLREMNFTNLVPQDNNAGIAIGGFTYGTNPLEMAAAYSTLARNGEYIKPTGIRKIIDVTNTVLYENDHAKKRIYDSGSAYLMTDVLKGVLTKPYATGYGLALKDMPAAGKTGTTNSNKDAWFAGYTPYYTTVVWVGNDIPARIPSLYGGTYPGRIWKDYMSAIHKGLPTKDFPMPNRISYMYVNPKTGEVDRNNDHGWWRRELVPEIYYEIQEREKVAAKLKRLEEKRKAEERRRQEELERIERRKAELDRHGITEEEEQQREEIAGSILTELEYASITSMDDIAYVEKLLREAKIAIENVVDQEARDILYHRYHVQVKRLERERYRVEHSDSDEVPAKEHVQDVPKESQPPKYNPTPPKYHPEPNSSKPTAPPAAPTKPREPVDSAPSKPSVPETPAKTEPVETEPKTPVPSEPSEQPSEQPPEQVPPTEEQTPSPSGETANGGK